MDKFQQVNKVKPIFFVFTCVKNGRQYIGKLFESLSKQSRKNFVHYIYEDGSDEPLDEIVDLYRKTVKESLDPYEIIYEQNNHNVGLNKATKHCIDKCSLPYFIWIDCDNWVNNTFFEELEKTAKKNPNAIYIGSNRIDVIDGKHVKYLSDFKRRMSVSGFFKDILFICASGFYYSFFAIKKDYYDIVSRGNFFVDSRDFYNDNQVITHCIVSGRSFASCKRAHSFYLFRENSEGNRFIDFNPKIEKHWSGIKEIAFHDDRKNKTCIDDILRIILLNAKIQEAKHNGSSDAHLLKKERNQIIKHSNLPLKYKLYFNIQAFWRTLKNK